MPTWPILPKPLLAGYSEGISDTTIRSDMDIGPAKVRQRTQAGADPLAFTMLVTAAELDSVMSFYKTTTKRGSIAFDMEHPRSHAAIRARFRSPPQFSALGNARYNVSVSLEVLP